MKLNKCNQPTSKHFLKICVKTPSFNIEVALDTCCANFNLK